MIEELTPFEMKKLLVEDFIERANAARSERIDKELKKLNVANKYFSLTNASIDVYV